jgi:hypothetical protein
MILEGGQEHRGREEGSTAALIPLGAEGEIEIRQLFESEDFDLELTPE